MFIIDIAKSISSLVTDRYFLSKYKFDVIIALLTAISTVLSKRPLKKTSHIIIHIYFFTYKTYSVTPDCPVYVKKLATSSNKKYYYLQANCSPGLLSTKTTSNDRARLPLPTPPTSCFCRNPSKKAQY